MLAPGTAVSTRATFCPAPGSPLNKYPRSRIEIFPEFLGGTGLFLLEDPVEIRNIIKAAIVGDLCNRMGRIDQHPGGMTQADLVQAVDKGIPRPFFYEAAEGDFG